MGKITPTVTAHRGGAHLGRENSLEALRRSTSLGVPWAEIDVQLTADGALVVVHDEDLLRVAGVAKKVSETTLDELRRASPAGQEGIPTLEECIAVVRGRTRLNIELKDYGHSAALPERVVAVLREKDFVGGARVSSFAPELVQQVRALEPRVEVGYAWEAAGHLPRAGEAEFLSVNHRAITGSLVRRAHRRGLEVHAWTVNDRADMLRLLAIGVDNLITDDPVLGKRAVTEFARTGPLARLWLRLQKRNRG